MVNDWRELLRESEKWAADLHTVIQDNRGYPIISRETLDNVQEWAQIGVMADELHAITSDIIALVSVEPV